MEENQKAIIGDISPIMIKICTFYSRERCKNLRKWSNMWSKEKNGLVQPRKQGRTSPLIILRKHEISRDFGRKIKKNRESYDSRILEKEEEIDIKIRSVSNRNYLFQSQNFCFKLILFVSKRFLGMKSAKIINFVAP